MSMTFQIEIDAVSCPKHRTAAVDGSEYHGAVYAMLDQNQVIVHSLLQNTPAPKRCQTGSENKVRLPSARRHARIRKSI